MKITTALAVCGGLLLGANATLNAQAAATPSAATAQVVTPKDIGTPEAWSEKPLGKYDLTVNIPEGAMPVEITISESKSGLSALFYKVGDNDAHVMTATVKGTDLILNGTTPHGALTMQIRHHGPALSGTWQVGDDRGTLEGSAKAAATASVEAESPEAWSAKPTGAYRVVMYDANPSGPMPVDLTLTEVDGKLSANFWVVGDHDGLPMSAVVKDKELVLNADTPRGPLEVRIEHRGAKLMGKWRLGYKTGKLDGNAKS